MVSLDNVRFLVLDEADRMLEMGFEDQIKEILNRCPAKEERQTTMWTATWPKGVRGLLREYFPPGYTQVTLGTGELQANPNIQQQVLVTLPQGRLNGLIALLEKYSEKKVMIFVNTKMNAMFLETELRRKKNRTSCVLTW